MRDSSKAKGTDWADKDYQVYWRDRWRGLLKCVLLSLSESSLQDSFLAEYILPFNADNVIRSGFKPFMEYAGSYALFNYRMADPSLGMAYTNLRLIRAFEHGLDPTSSEAGFVLVHIDMVKHSGQLVKGAVNALEACGNDDRYAFDEGMEGVVKALVEVNSVMDGMWKKSKPNDYTSFRTFIFGITKQSMFPHGVVYEGVSEEAMSFRGESGANDSMVSYRRYR